MNSIIADQRDKRNPLPRATGNGRAPHHVAATAAPFETAALELLGRGFSLFPLKPRDKLPAGELLPPAYDPSKRKDKPTWAPYRAAFPALAKIKEWARRSPRGNVAIVTGSLSRLLVIDADAPKEPGAALPGMAVEWLLEHGGQTLMSETGGGGLHALYRPLPGAPCPGNKSPFPVFPDGSEIHVRGEGGYIVAPGSVHPNGRPYTWREGTADLDPAPLPEALAALLYPPKEPGAKFAPVAPREERAPARSSQTEEQGTAVRLDSDSARARAERYVAAALGDLDTLRNTTEGSRNQTLFDTARRLFALADALEGDYPELADLLPVGDVAGLLERAAAGYIATDGRPAALKTIESARARPGSVNLPDFYEGKEPGANFAPVASGAGMSDETRAALRRVKTILRGGEGWDAGLCRTFAILETERMLGGKEQLEYSGGGAYVAKVVNVAKGTAVAHLERLEALELAEYDKGETVTNQRGERTRNSRVIIFPYSGAALPSAAGVTGARQGKQRDRSERARRRGWEAAQAQGQAVCPACEALGLALGCVHCDHVLDTAEAAHAIAAAMMPECKDCGARLPLDNPAPCCPACGTILEDGEEPAKKPRGSQRLRALKPPTGGAASPGAKFAPVAGEAPDAPKEPGANFAPTAAAPGSIPEPVLNILYRSISEPPAPPAWDEEPPGWDEEPYAAAPTLYAARSAPQADGAPLAAVAPRTAPRGAPQTAPALALDIEEPPARPAIVAPPLAPSADGEELARLKADGAALWDAYAFGDPRRAPLVAPLQQLQRAGTVATAREALHALRAAAGEASAA